jgi:hypothetical protein
MVAGEPTPHLPYQFHPAYSEVAVEVITNRLQPPVFLPV